MTSTELEQDVIRFVAETVGIRETKLSRRSSIQDLGVDGDDGVELLEGYRQRYSVDLSGLTISEYFGPEVGGNPLVWLWWFLTDSWPKLATLRVSDLINGIERGVLDDALIEANGATQESPSEVAGGFSTEPIVRPRDNTKIERRR